MNNNNSEKPCFARFGYVSDYDAKRHMARVIFPELDDVVSGWLQVGVMNVLKNHDEIHLDIGEHVFCILQGSGVESGVVLCSIYDDKNKPVVADENIRIVTFSDGAKIKIDREKHEIEIRDHAGDYITMCEGNMNIHANSHINITAARIDLN